MVVSAALLALVVLYALVWATALVRAIAGRSRAGWLLTAALVAPAGIPVVYALLSYLPLDLTGPYNEYSDAWRLFFAVLAGAPFGAVAGALVDRRVVRRPRAWAAPRPPAPKGEPLPGGSRPRVRTP